MLSNMDGKGNVDISLTTISSYVYTTVQLSPKVMSACELHASDS